MSVPEELRSYGKDWRGKRDIVIHGGIEHRPDTPCAACDFLDRAEAATQPGEGLRAALERLDRGLMNRVLRDPHVDHFIHAYSYSKSEQAEAICAAYDRARLAAEGE